MSEYWKSTPKYWCKHCKTFVKDTKFEKTNHEATPKHQGNLKRFLRDLHKGHEREEREKQRAKVEVDRLNGVVAGSGTKTVGNPWERKPAIPQLGTLRQATPADRKKQLAQLAELGVAVPEDFRKEMAMAGDWQVTSQTPIYDTVKKEEDQEDVKPGSISVGVRKRKYDGQEEEEQPGERMFRKGWGSTMKTYPGKNGDGEDDLETLLNATRATKKPEPGTMSPSRPQSNMGSVPTDAGPPDMPALKREDSLNTGLLDTSQHQKNNVGTPSVKQEDAEAEPGVIFKKRKSKPIRQK